VINYLLTFRLNLSGPTFKGQEAQEASTSQRRPEITHAQDTTALQPNILSPSDGATSPSTETPNGNALFRFDVGALKLKAASTTLH